MVIFPTTIIMIQLASSELWQVHSQCCMVFKGLVSAHPFSPPQIVRTLKTKHVTSARRRVGKLFQTGLFPSTEAACGAGELPDFWFFRGSDLGCGFGSTKKLWTPLSEWILHVYKISAVYTCVYIYTYIHIKKNKINLYILPKVK